MKDVSKKRSNFLRSKEGLYFFIGLLILSLNLLLFKVAYGQDDFATGDFGIDQEMPMDYQGGGEPSFDSGDESSMMDPVNQYDDEFQADDDEDLLDSPRYNSDDESFESPANPRFEEGGLPSLDNGGDDMEVVGGSAPMYE